MRRIALLLLVSLVAAALPASAATPQPPATVAEPQRFVFNERVAAAPQPVTRDGYEVVRLWSRPLPHPLELLSPFGRRIVITTSAGETSPFHAGADFRAAFGTHLLAVGPGTIEAAGVEGGLGLAVRLRLDDGTLLVYAHLSRVGVVVGQRVGVGEPLGASGDSGKTTSPHLHLEVIDQARGAIDPLPWLTERELR